MRPRGMMPDWASAGVQLDPGDLGVGGIVPKTADPRVRNWIIAKLREFKTARDAIECLQFSSDEAATQDQSVSTSEGPTIPSRDFGPHYFYDPENFRFVVGQRRSDDPTKAEINAFYDPFAQSPVAGFDLSSNGDGAHTADYSIVMGKTVDGLHLNVYMSSLNVRAVATGGAYAEQLDNTAEIQVWHPTGSVAGVWQPTSIPAAILRIGSHMYDPEESRFYIFGAGAGAGSIIIKTVQVTAAPGYLYEDQEIRTDAAVVTQLPRLSACTTGHKVMTTGKEIFRTSNRFTPWYGWKVSALLKNETDLLGLFRAETDGVFVGITENGVWTSPNGVIWAKTAAPKGTYTGAGAALGGLVVAAYQNGDGVYRLAVGTNALRTWTDINLPFQNPPSPSPGAQPVRQLFTLDNRLVVVSGTSPPQLAASLRL